MQRGPKPQLPSVKELRGTFKPCRDAGKVEVIEPDSMPIQPEWLTEAGQQVWLDEIGRVADGAFATEKDSTMFATFCNLQGAITMAWQSGAIPPAGALVEARKMAEQFGLFGRKSRLQQGAPSVSKKNPFLQRKV